MALSLAQKTETVRKMMTTMSERQWMAREHEVQAPGPVAGAASTAMPSSHRKSVVSKLPNRNCSICRSWWRWCRSVTSRVGRVVHTVNEMFCFHLTFSFHIRVTTPTPPQLMKMKGRSSSRPTTPERRHQKPGENWPSPIERGVHCCLIEL